MTKQFFWALVKRFLRAGIAGGLASAIAVLASNNLDLSSFENFTNWLGIILVAFVTGFLTACEKLMRFDKTKLTPVLLICILVTGSLMIGCTRRVEVVQAESARVVLNDRVTDLGIISKEELETLNRIIAELPEFERTRAFEAYFSARERVATAALQSEEKRGNNWISFIEKVLNYTGFVTAAVK